MNSEGGGEIDEFEEMEENVYSGQGECIPWREMRPDAFRTRSLSDRIGVECMSSCLRGIDECSWMRVASE